MFWVRQYICFCSGNGDVEEQRNDRFKDKMQGIFYAASSSKVVFATEMSEGSVEFKVTENGGWFF